MTEYSYITIFLYYETPGYCEINDRYQFNKILGGNQLLKICVTRTTMSRTMFLNVDWIPHLYNI